MSDYAEMVRDIIDEPATAAIGMRAIADKVRLIEAERSDVMTFLGCAWKDFGLSEPITFNQPVADAPALSKDALSLGLLEGTLAPHRGGLEGELTLSLPGKVLVRRFHRRLEWQ